MTPNFISSAIVDSAFGFVLLVWALFGLYKNSHTTKVYVDEFPLRA